jgi:hypothetical protein
LGRWFEFLPFPLAFVQLVRICELQSCPVILWLILGVGIGQRSSVWELQHPAIVLGIIVAVRLILRIQFLLTILLRFILRLRKLQHCSILFRIIVYRSILLRIIKHNRTYLFFRFPTRFAIVCVRPAVIISASVRRSSKANRCWQRL